MALSSRRAPPISLINFFFSFPLAFATSAPATSAPSPPPPRSSYPPSTTCVSPACTQRQKRVRFGHGDDERAVTLEALRRGLVRLDLFRKHQTQQLPFDEHADDASLHVYIDEARVHRAVGAGEGLLKQPKKEMAFQTEASWQSITRGWLAIQSERERGRERERCTFSKNFFLTPRQLRWRGVSPRVRVQRRVIHAVSPRISLRLAMYLPTCTSNTTTDLFSTLSSSRNLLHGFEPASWSQHSLVNPESPHRGSSTQHSSPQLSLKSSVSISHDQ